MLENSLIASIQTIIIRLAPNYVGHGGNIEFVDYNLGTGQVQVRLTGACAECGMSGITLQYGLLKELKKELPEVKEVIVV